MLDTDPESMGPDPQHWGKENNLKHVLFLPRFQGRIRIRKLDMRLSVAEQCLHFKVTEHLAESGKYVVYLGSGPKPFCSHNKQTTSGNLALKLVDTS